MTITPADYVKVTPENVDDCAVLLNQRDPEPVDLFLTSANRYELIHIKHFNPVLKFPIRSLTAVGIDFTACDRLLDLSDCIRVRLARCVGVTSVFYKDLGNLQDFAISEMKLDSLDFLQDMKKLNGIQFTSINHKKLPLIVCAPELQWLVMSAHQLKSISAMESCAIKKLALYKTSCSDFGIAKQSVLKELEVDMLPTTKICLKSLITPFTHTITLGKCTINNFEALSNSTVLKILCIGNGLTVEDPNAWGILKTLRSLEYLDLPRSKKRELNPFIADLNCKICWI